MKSDTSDFSYLLPPPDPQLLFEGLCNLRRYAAEHRVAFDEAESIWVDEHTRVSGAAPAARKRNPLLGKGVTEYVIFAVLLHPPSGVNPKAQQRLALVLVVLMAALVEGEPRTLGRYHSCSEQASRAFRQLVDDDDAWLFAQIDVFVSISSLLSRLRALEVAREVTASARRRRIVSGLRSFVEAATHARAIRSRGRGRRFSDFEVRLLDEEDTDSYTPPIVSLRQIEICDPEKIDLAPDERARDRQMFLSPAAATEPDWRINHVLPFAYHRQEARAHLPFREGATPAELEWLFNACRPA